MMFRKAVIGDEALVLEFIKGIAVYEKMEDQVVATFDSLHNALFVECSCEVIFVLNEENKEVGYALYFYNMSTFLGKKGLYLEDLFVLPEYRSFGYGKGLFLEVANIARMNDCGRMDWVCLDWNTPSRDFYASLGAKSQEEWVLYRLDEEGLKDLESKK